MFGDVEHHCYCEKHRTCKRGGDVGKTAGSRLPKISYNDSFEELAKHCASYNGVHLNYYDSSSTYDFSDEGLPELSDMGIGFINGINNSSAEARASASYISNLAGGCNVHAVYNATHGTFQDVIEAFYGLNYVATEPVRQLHSMWNSFFDKSSTNAKFLMICHSQGAVHVRNALLDYPRELRQRILVVAVAPAAYIYQETCGQLLHYRAEAYRDFIPHIDIFGARRAVDTTFSLPSHPNAEYHDHSFMSPTYQGALLQAINNYKMSLGRKM